MDLSGGTLMGPIKFRAWDKVNREWITDVVTMDCNGKLRSLVGGATIDVEWDEVDVGFFTGLHDKNGQDIYEGDILKHEDDFQYHVFFQEGCFMFCKKVSECEMANCGWSYYSEVIGNIHDNPDLIKGAPHGPTNQPRQQEL